MTRRQLTEHALFKLAKYWWPKLTVAGGLLWGFWNFSGDAHDFTKSIADHLKYGKQIVEEQKKTNDKLDVLIGIESGRRVPRRLTGQN